MNIIASAGCAIWHQIGVRGRAVKALEDHREIDPISPDPGRSLCRRTGLPVRVAVPYTKPVTQRQESCGYAQAIAPTVNLEATVNQAGCFCVGLGFLSFAGLCFQLRIKMWLRTIYP